MSNHYDSGESVTDEDVLLEDVNEKDLLVLQGRIDSINTIESATERLEAAEQLVKELNA